MVYVCEIQHFMCVFGSKRNVWACWCVDVLEVVFLAEVG